MKEKDRLNFKSMTLMMANFFNEFSTDESIQFFIKPEFYFKCLILKKTVDRNFDYHEFHPCGRI